MAVAHRRDRAVLDACRHGLDLRRFKAFDHLLRVQPRREVDVADRQAEQLVANRAANVAGQPLVAAERVKQPRHALDGAPIARIELQLHVSRVRRRDRLTMIAAVAPQILRPFHSIS